MIRILSIGSTELVFLHLFIHAIFKSLIFYMLEDIYIIYIWESRYSFMEYIIFIH